MEIFSENLQFRPNRERNREGDRTRASENSLSVEMRDNENRK